MLSALLALGDVPVDSHHKWPMMPKFDGSFVVGKNKLLGNIRVIGNWRHRGVILTILFIQFWIRTFQRL